MINLKLGDKIYFSRYGSLERFERIIKVTPTMFKTESYTLKVYGDYIKIVGSDIWSPSAKLATPELDEQWRKKKIVSWFHSHKFTEDEMIEVYELLNK
jgi:hypothetical protein